MVMLASRRETEFRGLAHLRDRGRGFAPTATRDGANRRSIGGYAVVFDSFSQPLGGFIERIAPSCFKKSRADGWPGVVARFNHNDDSLLGTVDSGSLELECDEVGVRYLVRDVPLCRDDALEAIQRGDVKSSSFAFQCYEDEWSLTGSGLPVRTLLSARLIDVAPVVSPAYVDATVGLRSLARHVDAPIDEVFDHAQRGGVFTRNDGRPNRDPLHGRDALAIIMAKRPTMSGAAALEITKAKRGPRSGAEALRETELNYVPRRRR